MSITIFTNTVKLVCYVPCICMLLKSVYTFIDAARTSTRTVLCFPGICICALCPLPRLYIQIDHKFAFVFDVTTCMVVERNITCVI